MYIFCQCPQQIFLGSMRAFGTPLSNAFKEDEIKPFTFAISGHAKLQNGPNIYYFKERAREKERGE